MEKQSKTRYMWMGLVGIIIAIVIGFAIKSQAAKTGGCCQCRTQCQDATSARDCRALGPTCKWMPGTECIRNKCQ